MPRLLLASSSPRRHQLMGEAGYQFEICCSNVEEISDDSMNAVELTIANAKLKADPVSNANPDSIVIGADTVVSLDDRIFGKPTDLKHASVMLGQLVGRTHNVTTGVSILSLNHKVTESKVPLLTDCLASMECTIKEAYEGGDHTIFVGQIEQGFFNEESEPLVYYKSGLGDFKPN